MRTFAITVFTAGFSAGAALALVAFGAAFFALGRPGTGAIDLGLAGADAALCAVSVFNARRMLRL